MTMTLQEFINKWNNRGIDFDGYYGNQCMDLMHQYVVEVLGLTDGRILAAPSARSVYVNFPSVVGGEYFEKIENTINNVPQAGDIVFWTNQPYGHVAIFVEGDLKKFRSFDQNFPTGSKCHIQEHTYTDVGGWLRIKQTKQEDIQKTLDELRIARDENWNLYQNELQKNTELSRKVGELSEQNTGLQKQIRQVNQESSALLDSYKEKLEQDATAIDAGLKAADKLKEAEATLDAVRKALKLPYDADEGVIIDTILGRNIVDDKAVKEYQRLFDLVFEEGLGVYKRLKKKDPQFISKVIKWLVDQVKKVR